MAIDNVKMIKSRTAEGLEDSINDFIDEDLEEGEEVKAINYQAYSSVVSTKVVPIYTALVMIGEIENGIVNGD